MKFYHNVGENGDKSQPLCKYRENILEKRCVARKQLRIFSSCVWRGRKYLPLAKYGTIGGN